MSNKIAEPWNSFLSDLDRGLSTRIVLHCLGGFAINLTYGLSRQTADVDMCEVAPISAKSRQLTSTEHCWKYSSNDSSISSLTIPKFSIKCPIARLRCPVIRSDMNTELSTKTGRPQ